MDRYYSPKETGARLKLLRIEQGRGTQEQVCHELNFSAGSYGNLERGAVMSIDRLVDVALYYEVSLDYLIWGVSTDTLLDMRLRSKINTIAAAVAAITEIMGGA